MQTIIITGASSGLGRTLSLGFARDGCYVHAVARSAEKLDGLAAEMPGRIEAYVCDVSKSAQVKKVCAEIQEKSPQIDVLINNASIPSQGMFSPENDFSVIDQVIDINLKGTMYCTYAVLPGMMQNRKGRIINISSTAGIPGEKVRPAPGSIPLGDYSASKFGVTGFAETMARGLTEYNILMTTLHPGGINTPFWDRNGASAYPFGDANKALQPEDLYELVKFLISQPDHVLYKQMALFPTCEWH